MGLRIFFFLDMVLRPKKKKNAWANCVSRRFGMVIELRPGGTRQGREAWLGWAIIACPSSLGVFLVPV